MIIGIVASAVSTGSQTTHVAADHVASWAGPGGGPPVGECDLVEAATATAAADTSQTIWMLSAEQCRERCAWWKKCSTYEFTQLRRSYTRCLLTEAKVFGTVHSAAGASVCYAKGPPTDPSLAADVWLARDTSPPPPLPFPPPPPQPPPPPPPPPLPPLDPCKALPPFDVTRTQTALCGACVLPCLEPVLDTLAKGPRQPVDFSTCAALKGADLRRASLAGAAIEGDYEAAAFDCADLSGARLSGSFKKASFAHANLDGAVLSESLLEAAGLSQVPLPCGPINQPSTNECQAADFSQASLRGATFQAATDVTKTNLTGVQAAGARFTDVESSGGTVLDSANLSHVRPVTRPASRLAPRPGAHVSSRPSL